MNDVIRDLLRIVRADAIARNVSLIAEIDPNAGVVMADRVQLLQVLLNLTMNAFEALTVVRADARQVVIRAERVQNGKICVSVRDSGPGFPDGIVDQLFEPFFSTKAEGTGMGLAIARSIIEAHGGRCFPEKTATAGALFTICLPRNKRSQFRTPRNSSSPLLGWHHRLISETPPASMLRMEVKFRRTAPVGRSRRGRSATNRSRGRGVWCAWRGVRWGRG